MSAGSFRASFSNPSRSIEHVSEKIFSPCSPIQQTSNFSFDTSTPTKKLMTYTSHGSIRKTGIASGQSSIVTRAHLRPNQLIMAPRGRGQTENKGSATQEAISPPAFLGANLTCLKIVIQELMVGGRSSVLPWMCSAYIVDLLGRHLHSVLECLLQTDVQGIVARRCTSIPFPQTSQEPYCPMSILASALFMAWMFFYYFSSSIARTSAIAFFSAVSARPTSCVEQISRAPSLILWASKISSVF